MKTYIIGDPSIVNFLSDIEIVNSIQEAEVVVFGDGEDVTPSFYKEKKLKSTKNNYQKDLKERALYKQILPNQFVIGIGRGAQFLAVLNGAKLHQNIYNHLNTTHKIIWDNGLVLQLYSNHHQAIDYNSIPKYGYVLAYIDELNGDDKKPMRIPEIVFFNQKDCPKTFCIQGRPDIAPETAASKYINTTIHKLW